MDNSAKGLARLQILPYDKNLLVNESAVIDIPKDILDSKKNKDKEYSSDSSVIKTTEAKCYNTRDTFNDFFVFYNSLIKETPVHFVPGEMVKVEPIEKTRLIIPRVLKDGKKHQFYRASINAMILLNPGISLEDVFRFIDFINENFTDGKKMKPKEMRRLVEHTYNHIVTTGEINAPFKVQKVHTNPNADNRRSLAAQANGQLKKNASIYKIQCAVDVLVAQGVQPTISAVEKLTKGFLSRRTIHRHWNNIVTDRKEI